MTPQGWSDEDFLRTVHRWGDHHGTSLCWPNYEAGHLGTNTVWGSYLWPAGSPHLLWGDVPGAAGGLGIPSLTPVADAWRAGHRYASSRGNTTGLLTFEASHHGPDPVFGLVQVKPSAGLVHRDIPRHDLGSPSFSDPGAVIQAVDRWAHAHDFLAGFPTFEQGLGPGGQVVYGAYLVQTHGTTGVTHRDIPEPELVALGPAPSPGPPPQLGLALTLTREHGAPAVFRGSIGVGTPGAKRTISWCVLKAGGPWQVARTAATHRGVTATDVLFDTFLHDFDGQLPTDDWSVSVQGSQIIGDSMSVSIGLAP